MPFIITDPINNALWMLVVPGRGPCGTDLRYPGLSLMEALDLQVRFDAELSGSALPASR
jgi:hypothetical protein